MPRTSQAQAQGLRYRQSRTSGRARAFADGGRSVACDGAEAAQIPKGKGLLKGGTGSRGVVGQAALANDLCSRWAWALRNTS